VRIDEMVDLLGRDVDRVQYANVPQLAFVAQPVDRGRADSETRCDLTHGEQRRLGSALW